MHKTEIYDLTPVANGQRWSLRTCSNQL